MFHLRAFFILSHEVNNLSNRRGLLPETSSKEEVGIEEEHFSIELKY